MSEGIQNHYFSRLMPQFSVYTPVHEVVAAGPVDSVSGTGLAELCLMRKNDSADPHYALLTSDGLYAQIGYTGLVSSLKELGASGLSTIFQRKSGYGVFTRNGVLLPNTDATLVDGIDEVYTTISGLDFYDDERRELFEWRAQQMLARFGEYSKLFGETDIVPEYNDTMNVITVSKRCPRHCIYCPEAGNLELFTREAIEGNMKLARRMQEKYHGRFKFLMNEGFINSSDLLWFNLYRKKDPSIMDPIEIAQMFKTYFPEVTKLYTFVGVPTTNATSLSYLHKLYNRDRLVNRVLLGIESGDEPTSRFLGKNESNADKARAVRKLQDAGFKVKVIVQVGMTGRGFYDQEGNFHDSREALENTAGFLRKVMQPYTSGNKNKVLISRYTPIQGTQLKQMHEEGKVVVPFSSSSELEEQVEWLVHELKKDCIDVEAEYENALEGRVRMAA